jgi:hypothetical protein
MSRTGYLIPFKFSFQLSLAKSFSSESSKQSSSNYSSRRAFFSEKRKECFINLGIDGKECSINLGIGIFVFVHKSEKKNITI